MENPKLWLDEWLELWPKEIQNGGMAIKSPAKYCVNKIIKFCKDYPQYTKDVIFAATKRYLQERKAENYTFTKRATYFINKLGEESVLEAYCQKILHNEPKQQEKNFEYNPINDFI